MATGYLIDERPLLCGMCHRRICDIAVINGDVALLRTSFREGIPQQKVPEGRVARGSGAVQGERPRDPNVRIFISESRDRFRIVHEHKRNSRGPLDRTITATTLEKIYIEAVASDQREVVLR